MGEGLGQCRGIGCELYIHGRGNFSQLSNRAWGVEQYGIQRALCGYRVDIMSAEMVKFTNQFNSGNPTGQLFYRLGIQVAGQGGVENKGEFIGTHTGAVAGIGEVIDTADEKGNEVRHETRKVKRKPRGQAGQAKMKGRRHRAAKVEPGRWPGRIRRVRAGCIFVPMNSTRRAPLLAPSFLAADLANLQAETELLATSAADWLHFDVMDGRFVPNISFGLPVLQAVARYAKQPIDVHLMIEEPQHYLSAFRDAGASIITVHYEACPHLHRVVQQIKQLGCRAGVALNPHTPVALLEDIAADLDLVLIMSVNPGFGGQTFIPNTLKKVAMVKELLLDAGSDALIEVDGGVNMSNAGPLVEAGADVLVAGNFVFSAPEGPVATLASLRDHLAGLEMDATSASRRQ